MSTLNPVVTKDREIIATYFFFVCLFFKHFCAMGSFTSTCRRFLFPWSSATLISWSPPLPSPFTEVLNKNHGSLSSKCFRKALCQIWSPFGLQLLLQLSFLQSIFIVLLRCLSLCRTITNSLPNVALPKVPSLPLNLPQIPSFSTPTWMASLYDSTCVFLTDR